MTELIPTHDADFEWMLGGPRSRTGLRLPPGGVDAPATLAIVREIHAAGRPGAWMMVAEGEVVGLCGAVRPIADRGAMEIGYGVAAARRRRGHASRAVAAMIALARAEGTVRCVTAVTAENNLASHKVLIANGFTEVGRDVRDEDGPVILWRLAMDLGDLDETAPLSSAGVGGAPNCRIT